MSGSRTQTCLLMRKPSSKILFDAACTFSPDSYRRKGPFVIWGQLLCDPHLPLRSPVNSLLLYFRLQKLMRCVSTRAWPTDISGGEIQGVALQSSMRAGASYHAPLSVPFSVLVHQRGSHFFPKALEQVSLAQSLHRGTLTCLVGPSRTSLPSSGWHNICGQKAHIRSLLLWLYTM